LASAKPTTSRNTGQTAINLAVDFLVAANAPCSEALRLALCGPLAYFDDDMSASSAAPTSKKSLTETIRAAAKAAVKILDKKKKIAPAASWNQVVETLDDILTKRKARTPGAKKRLGSWLAKLAGQSTSEEATPTASSESEDQLSQPTATKITQHLTLFLELTVKAQQMNSIAKNSLVELLKILLLYQPKKKLKLLLLILMGSKTL